MSTFVKIAEEAFFAELETMDKEAVLGINSAKAIKKMLSSKSVAGGFGANKAKVVTEGLKKSRAKFDAKEVLKAEKAGVKVDKGPKMVKEKTAKEVRVEAANKAKEIKAAKEAGKKETTTKMNQTHEKKDSAIGMVDALKRNRKLGLAATAGGTLLVAGGMKNKGGDKPQVHNYS